MAGARKKTPAQHVVNLAAPTMPHSVKKIITSRWGARVVLLVVGLLVASGVVTFQWSDGVPHVKVDRDRALEIEHRVAERLEEVREDFTDDDEKRPLRDLLPKKLR